MGEMSPATKTILGMVGVLVVGGAIVALLQAVVGPMEQQYQQQYQAGMYNYTRN
jgi:hypothetical protein